MEKKLETLENTLSFALVALGSVAFKGPALVPMGKAMEAVSGALGIVQGLREEAKPEFEGNMGCGPGPVGKKGKWGGPCPGCGAQELSWDPETDITRCLACGYTIGGTAT